MKTAKTVKTVLYITLTATIILVVSVLLATAICPDAVESDPYWYIPGKIPQRHFLNHP